MWLERKEDVATAGTLPVDVSDLGVDALSLATSPFYGPKGAGALYVRKGVRLKPQIDGGVQERGLRAGTERGRGPRVVLTRNVKHPG